MVVGYDKPIDKYPSALASARHHSYQVLLAAFWLFLDERKGQIKPDVLTILIVELFHLRSDDEEDIRNVWIGCVYLMHIFSRFGVIVTDAGKILIDLFVGDIFLIDI